MRKYLVDATDSAIRAVNAARFFQTERGIHGQVYCSLQAELDRAGLLADGAILEMEYQKGAAHGMRQRPDMILHVPAEHSNVGRRENNFAVWALKRDATVSAALEDFTKLDEMFELLGYPVGFFVNIDATSHMAEKYAGKFRNRLEAVAASLNRGIVRTN